MKQALIIASGIGINGEKLNLFPQLVVSEVLQFKRLLINSERAGISRFTIFCEESSKLSLLKIANDRRIQSQIEFVCENDQFNFEDDSAYLIQSNLITYSTTIKAFIESAEKESGNTVLSDSEDKIYGLLKLKKSDINKIRKSGDLRDLLQGKSKSPLKNLSISDGYMMNLAPNQESLDRAKDVIFSNVGKTATGWIAVNINGRFSIPLSRHLVKTSLTPNMISVLINVIGILSGPFYALGHPVIAAICMQIATILDRCDGEVARVKLMETKKGQWVDTISDQVSMLSFYIGLPIGYYILAQSNWIIAVGFMNVFFYLFFIAWSFYFLLKYTDSGSLVAYMDVDNLIDEKKTTVVRKFISFLRPLGRRNIYSIAFLVLAIIGGTKFVFILATIGITFFFLHVLEDIIKLSKIKKREIYS